MGVRVLSSTCLASSDIQLSLTPVAFPGHQKFIGMGLDGEPHKCCIQTQHILVQCGEMDEPGDLLGGALDIDVADDCQWKGRECR